MYYPTVARTIAYDILGSKWLTDAYFWGLNYAHAKAQTRPFVLHDAVHLEFLELLNPLEDYYQISFL